MSIQRLSRLSITGEINFNTPLCVLLEIAGAHGIKYEDDNIKRTDIPLLIDKIYKTDIPSVSSNKTGKDWSYIARFVNKNINWSKSTLIEAYNFLISFCTEDDVLNKIPSKYNYGLQTMEDTHSINACILYKICKYHDLKLNTHISINQMAYAVNLLKEESTSILRRVNYYINNECNLSNLISVLLLTDREIKDPQEKKHIIEEKDHYYLPKQVITHNLLEEIYPPLHNIKVLQEIVPPTTDLGAVALAALNFTLDLSKISNPLEEYKNIRLNGIEKYKPENEWMKYWYDKNPLFFDLNVMFNPIFPKNFYTAENLNKLVFNEGFVNNDLINNAPYELLQLAYVSETFYLGPMPNIKTKTTLISLDNIDEIPRGELFLYGCIDRKLDPISLDELFELFSNNKNFNNPFAKDAVFDKRAVKKLKFLLNKSIVNFNSETLDKRTKLIEMISHIELLTFSTDPATKRLIDIYLKVDKNKKAIMLTILKCLLNIGLYMRGWLGGDHPYPIIKAPVPVEMEGVVSMNVSTEITRFENLCRENLSLGNIISNLPLVRYRDGQYQISTVKSDGLTIGERLSIVKDGEATSNTSACIRLSSNWICASAHKYLCALGQNSPFDIFNLRDIS